MAKPDIYAHLAKLGVTLPRPPQPAANYVPVRLIGSIAYVSGQAPREGPRYLFIGKLGAEISLEDGRRAARLCAINMLAQLDACLPDGLKSVAGCIKLVGFVNATPNFIQHSKVVDGASDFMVEALGEQGRHARTAIGCSSLPGNIPVEVEGVFALR